MAHRIFAGGCANFEVANVTQHAAGDHTIFIGSVERFTDTPDLAPLLFHAGRYADLG